MQYRFIKNRDIIMFGFQPWNTEIAFNFKDMAYELARYNRVLFIDRALDRKTALKNRITQNLKAAEAGKNNYIEQIQDNFWVLHPKSLLESSAWSPNYKLFDFFNRVNNRRIAAEIKKAIHSLGFKNSLLINDNDFYRGLYLKGLLPVREYIFYLRDFLTAQPFFERYGPRCEKEMIEKSDLVVANSAYLAAHAGQWNPNSVDIGQGCNPDDFITADQPVPADMKDIPGPILGYCGVVSSYRLDEDILIHLSESFPNYSIVLVGPSDSVFDKSRLRSLRNVFFLGRKMPGETIAYIQHFTICLNPQVLNPLTIGNYPRKIDEYLAAGKPVVATATEAMKMFGEYTFLCASKEDYVTSIVRILEDPEWTSSTEKEKRRNFALTHTWENSVGALGNAFYHFKKQYPAVGL
ncbi:MAG: glycosyltransferase [Bacteroidota bacterium]|nr:glycosyltransferase [Bacteroidota bacterium]MDP4248786.1 glycosyltransferase [Bacteroidota bacterium]